MIFHRKKRTILSNPTKEGGDAMGRILFLIIGLMVGGTLGVVLMCLLQISRFTDISDEE